MKQALLLLAVTLGTSSAHASESCVMRAAKLLSGGEHAELARLFTKPTEKIVTELQALGRRIGKLDRIVNVPSMPAGQTSRLGVTSADLPARLQFKGEFATATSSAMGSVWLQASTPLNGECRLLELYVNKPA